MTISAQDTKMIKGKVEEVLDKFGVLVKDEIRRVDGRVDNLELDLQQQGSNPGTGEPKAGTPAGRVLNSTILPFVREGDDSGIKNAMQAGSGPDGGYSVIPEMDSVIHTVERDLSPIFDDSRKVVCNSSTHELLMNTDLTTAAWVGERESRDAVAGPTFKLIETPVHEQSCLVEVTQRLIDDSAFQIEQFVADNVATSFAIAAGTSFLTGDGIEQPMGIRSYDVSTDDDDTRAWKTIQYNVTGASGGFLSAASGAADCFFECVSKMRSGYLPGCRWYMSRSTAAAVRTLKDANGNYYWQDNYLQGNMPPSLIGYPVRLCEDMEDIGADSFSIMFANLSKGYVIPYRPGMRYLRDPYTNKPFIRLFFTRRIGGGCADFNAIKLIKFGTS